jgi:sec-independent protein translocase protein TatB
MAVLTAAAAMPGAIIGILESLSGVEFIVIAVFAFLVLGPEKLPDAMRKAGRALGEVRKITAGFQEEVRAAVAEAEAATRLPDDLDDATDSSTPSTPAAQASPAEPEHNGAPPESDEPS